MSTPSIIVFGSQIGSLSRDALIKLRRSLHSNCQLVDFVNAINSLPHTWDVLVASDPSLSSVRARDAIEQLAKFFGAPDAEPEYDLGLGTEGNSLPNAMLAPLTVIVHITEYFAYLKHAGHTHRELLRSTMQQGGYQGLCTGLLAAIALSISENETQAAQIAATALRLALAIGAYIDLNGQFADPPREVSCYVVRWKHPITKELVTDVIAKHPQAYISVVSDSSTITVTVDRESAPIICQELTALGATIRAIPLHGRFHHGENAAACKKVLSLGRSDPQFRFPQSIRPLSPVMGGDGTAIVSEEVSEVVVRSIMVDQASWQTVLGGSLVHIQGASLASKPSVVSIGLIDCVPRSFINKYDLDVLSSSSFGGAEAKGHEHIYSDDAIAIVGMACRLPGADSVDEFWQLLLSGSSMLGQLPAERFPTTGLRRTPKDDRPFLGNFLRDGYAFDHKFFDKSTREAASMDPQHKLILQVAYEAMEAAGHFSRPCPATDVGCYMGVAASDYEDNVASHAPTAYSVLGAVRAFVSGKISHFLGLSGPSLVFDTACSSSAVAIHTACQAIRAGDCSMALAGGVNVITSPTLHQNLAAANFLSPTGESKSFDARADGYCRGEGAGVLVLKRYSAAVACGDNILGVIAGSAVNQNANSAPITVPVSSSQTNLYRRVLERARLDPKNVSFVEAHGTGTPKGDPIECASIRELFGGQATRKLHFGSVKGSIGHLEGASGVAGIIKVLLMMQHRTITPQASFESLNPNIPPLGPSNMEISRATKSWDVEFMAACVNNYGAAGSNAALLICQKEPSRIGLNKARQGKSASYPVVVRAKSSSSLSANCRSLLAFLDRQREIDDASLLADTAYWLAQRQNPELPYSWSTRVETLQDLRKQLESHIATTQDQMKTLPRPSNTATGMSTVLVFSGQTGTTVKISKEAYESSVLLRRHLDRCDRTIQSLGYTGVLQAIFKGEPFEDIVRLHCAMFAAQYACAQSWIDSGVQVRAMVGHSFGQLTALCVAGAMSLEDGLKIVASRAALMDKKWGAERGTMLSVAGVEATRLRQLVTAAHQEGIDTEIACYNAPTSQVVVGSEASIVAFEKFISRDQHKEPVQLKRLDVTHGFHSKFVENIMPEYEDLLKTIRFHEPRICVETCSPGESWAMVTSELVAAQSREPVHFVEAIQRIETRLGACVWLEAGSATAAIPLARRALETKGSDPSPHSFHQVNLSGSKPMEALADVTLGLWDRGVKTQFWPFHHCQKDMYSALHLPPYQFEKHHHWLQYVDKHLVHPEDAKQATGAGEPPKMVSFIKYLDSARKVSVFNIDQSNFEFESSIEGHSVLGNPLCPLSLYVEMATRAAALVTPGFVAGSHIPELRNLEITSPLGKDASRTIQVTLKQQQGSEGKNSWEATFSSFPLSDPSKTSHHASASVMMTPSQRRKGDSTFSRYRRLVSTKKCKAILAEETSGAIQGPLVYKMFEKVVHYSDIYRGVQKISSRDGEVAGYVLMPPTPVPALDESICNPLAIDNFTQVAGLHVNGLDECGADEVYICSKVEQIQLAKSLNGVDGPSRGPWLVYSNFAAGEVERELINDIYIFDAPSGDLVMTIVGVSFTRTNVHSLQRVLERANRSTKATPAEGSGLASRLRTAAKAQELDRVSKPNRPQKSMKPQSRAAEGYGQVTAAVHQLLHEVADVPLDEIHPDIQLSNVGIDSLMATEVTNAINHKFGITISAELLNGDVGSLCRAIADLGTPNSSPSSNVDGESDTDNDSMQSDITTPLSGGSGYASPALKTDPAALARLDKLVAEHLDLPSNIPSSLLLSEAGVDSLMGIELGSAIEHEFGVKLDIMSLPRGFVYGDLVDLIIPPKPTSEPEGPRQERKGPAASKALSTLDSAGISSNFAKADEHLKLLEHAVEDFADVRSDYQRFAKEAGYADFRTQVYPKQRKLVAAYILEAFAALGCVVADLKPGQTLPATRHIPRHDKVIGQYLMVLRDESLIRHVAGKYVRTEVPVEKVDATQLHEDLVAAYPQHEGELRLLRSTGTKLAEVLVGNVDPIHILFGTKADRDLLEDVYVNSPMWLTGTKVLANYFTKAFSRLRGSRGKLRILELGAGTGGTTRHILQTLTALGVDFTYTFTDLSSSLVAAAKRKFSNYGDAVEYTVLDVEKPPPADHVGKYHVILSSNCVHATKDLQVSTATLRKLLREDGILCLLELTRNIYWLDCVFGLLEGWWLFEDGRKHALADEFLWRSTLLQSGFQHVDWSDDSSEESDQYRLIVGFASAPARLSAAPLPSQPLQTKETVEYANISGLSLQADIYYPQQSDNDNRQRPIALMIHGGGHIMLSRKDIRPRQTRLLLEKGFLPVSIDYRLCPEVTLTEGPMADVCTALHWCRTQLPGLAGAKARTDVRPDGDRVVVVGWSTGGTLAMSLAWTAAARGVRPPDAVLAFYCPSDYESEFWRTPNYPEKTEAAARQDLSQYDLLEGVSPDGQPLTAYNVPPSHGAVGGWMSLADPRSRIALHMNWRGQTLPTLLDGLPSRRRQQQAEDDATAAPVTGEDWKDRPQPSAARVASVSPYARIRAGDYLTPTFLIHGTADDLVPSEQSRKVRDALEQEGVPCGLAVVEDAVHLFDLYPDSEGRQWAAVQQGYEFLARQLQMPA